MKKDIKLNFINILAESIEANLDLIQVIIGPRQVGKTTGILQYLEGLDKATYSYVSADGQIQRHGSWLEEQWSDLHSRTSEGLLVIDEIQKVENWSEVVKKLWDRQKRQSRRMRLVVLGSSSLEIQKGLSESLTGRFILHRVHQWSAQESQEAYGVDFEDYLLYGGYPGSYAFIAKRAEWLNYIRHSIIDTVIGKDILNLARVKSPSLFRQSFDLICAYSAQEISYTKLLGQLQEKGNVELVKHYLELFEGAFLIKQLFKYSNKKTLSRSSSPKILPLCPALYSNALDADFNNEQRGRAFEIAVGCALMRLPGSLYYWRQGQHEVDYIYQYGKKLFAIEVKSGRKKSTKGLSRFVQEFKTATPLIITPESFATVFQGGSGFLLG